jgi:hypothetical protein
MMDEAGAVGLKHTREFGHVIFQDGFVEVDSRIPGVDESNAAIQDHVQIVAVILMNMQLASSGHRLKARPQLS